MVDAVTGCLHLLPAHGGHIKAAPGCPDALAGFQIVRGKLRLPFLQKLRHLGKAHPIAVMGGILSVLMQHHDIRYRQGVPREVCQTVHIEPGINAFQIILRRQRRRIDQLIILRFHGKTVAVDTVQRLETIVQRFIAAFELINGKAVFRSLILNGLRLCNDIRRGLHIGGCRRRILPFRSFRSGQHFIHTGFSRVLQSRFDFRRIKVKKFLIARGRTDQERSIRDDKKKLEQAKKRLADLDVIISRLYEDYVLGNLNQDRYRKMSADYEAEQERLKLEIEVIEEWVEQREEMNDGLDAFIALTQKYVDVEELTQTIVNEYIKKIVVYAPDKSSGKRKQKVKIFFNFVDDVDIPVISEPIVTQTTYERRKTA